eukprot:263909-Hanusia_phi.AAC.1
MSLICLDDFLGDEFHLLGRGSKSTKASFIVGDSGRQAHAALRIHLTQKNGLYFLQAAKGSTMSSLR